MKCYIFTFIAYIISRWSVEHAPKDPNPYFWALLGVILIILIFAIAVVYIISVAVIALVKEEKKTFQGVFIGNIVRI